MLVTKLLLNVEVMFSVFLEIVASVWSFKFGTALSM